MPLRFVKISAKFLSSRTGYLGSNYPNQGHIRVNDFANERGWNIKLYDFRRLAQLVDVGTEMADLMDVVLKSIF